jgi:hypothetical protein
VRRPIDNPFTPGSDTVPQVWAGRVDQLSDWANIFRPRLIAGLPERGRTILGEAGLGKSALVRRIAGDAEARGDWVTPQIRIPAGADSLKLVAAAALGLADQAGLSARREKRIRETLDRVRTVAVKGISLTVDRAPGPEPFTALTELLVEIGIAAVNHGNTVVLHIDEVQNIVDGNELSQLLISLGDAITHEHRVIAPGGIAIGRSLPIAVYLTGLPEFAEMTEARKGATFARRFATTTLTPVADDDIALALRPFITEGWEVPSDAGDSTRITMTADAADAIKELCRGEPFLFQLAGERAWYAGTSDVITTEDVVSGWKAAAREAAAHVERILSRLPRQELTFLESMAKLDFDSRTLTNIAQELGYRQAAQLGQAARRLDTIRGIIDRGKPYSFRHRAVESYLTSNWPRID